MPNTGHVFEIPEYTQRDPTHITEFLEESNAVFKDPNLYMDESIFHKPTTKAFAQFVGSMTFWTVPTIPVYLLAPEFFVAAIVVLVVVQLLPLIKEAVASGFNSLVEKIANDSAPPPIAPTEQEIKNHYIDVKMAFIVSTYNEQERLWYNSPVTPDPQSLNNFFQWIEQGFEILQLPYDPYSYAKVRTSFESYGSEYNLKMKWRFDVYGDGHDDQLRNGYGWLYKRMVYDPSTKTLHNGYTSQHLHNTIVDEFFDANFRTQFELIAKFVEAKTRARNLLMYYESLKLKTTQGKIARTEIPRLIHAVADNLPPLFVTYYFDAIEKFITEHSGLRFQHAAEWLNDTTPMPESLELYTADNAPKGLYVLPNPFQWASDLLFQEPYDIVIANHLFSEGEPMQINPYHPTYDFTQLNKEKIDV